MPGRINYRFEYWLLPHAKLTKRLRTRYENAIKEGVKAWVEKAYASIPVYSGASAETLNVIAQAVGANVPTFGPTANAIEYLGYGEIQARLAKARSQTSASLKSTPTGAVFEYRTTLQWLVDNEKYNMQASFRYPDENFSRLVKPTPWNFRSRANIAFQIRFNKKLKGITIDLRRSLEKKVIRN